MVFFHRDPLSFLSFPSALPMCWREARQALLITLLRWGKGLRSYMASPSPQMQVVEWKLPRVWCPRLCFPFPRAPNLNQFWDTFFHFNLTKTQQHISWLSPPDENVFLWLETSLRNTLVASEYPDTNYQVLLEHLHGIRLLLNLM